MNLRKPFLPKDRVESSLSSEDLLQLLALG